MKGKGENNVYSDQRGKLPSVYHGFIPPNADYQVGLLSMSTLMYGENLMLLEGIREEYIFRPTRSRAK